MPIRFLFQIDDFNISNKRIIKSWVIACAKKEKKHLGQVDFIFCSDDYLHNLNVKYLNHNTLTDIITFDYSAGKEISGEIYISKERVVENSIKYSVDFKSELHRVMIHGVLHLCGYKDKKPEDKIRMRKKEDSCLSLLKNMFHVKPS